MSTDRFLREQSTVRSRRLAQAENSARQATISVTQVTHGPGEIAQSEPVMFGATFVEEPSVSIGSILYGEPKPGDFPVIGAFLHGKVWALNDRGYFVGFYPAYRIASKTKYKIQHCFTFTGVALKNAPGM